MSGYIPDGWEIHDRRWLIHEEQVAPKVWLLCFVVRPDFGEDPEITGWVSVLDRKWPRGIPTASQCTIEEHRLDRPSGLLEITCMMHEMREKYKSP